VRRLMPKHSKEAVVKDVIQVLNILEKNGKESVDNIAKKCGVSRQKVWRIIKDLEEKNVIWGYAATTDGRLRGLQHFVLLIKRNIVPIDKAFKEEVTLKKLEGYVPGFVHIENIFFTHGEYNAVVTFYAKDLKNATKLVQELFNKIGQYFEGYLLLETIFPIRKNGFENPEIKELMEYF